MPQKGMQHSFVLKYLAALNRPITNMGSRHAIPIVAQAAILSVSKSGWRPVLLEAAFDEFLFH